MLVKTTYLITISDFWLPVKGTKQQSEKQLFTIEES